MTLNPSELALLQRLTRPDLPRRRDGGLMGPQTVWLRLLSLIDLWMRARLNRRSRALTMLKQSVTMPDLGHHGRNATNR